AGRMSQCVIHQGMMAAARNGATTKKMAEPKMALVFCIILPPHVLLAITPAACPATAGRQAAKLAPSAGTAPTLSDRALQASRPAPAHRPCRARQSLPTG